MTSPDDDADAIADVLNRFFAAVSFEAGERPSYRDLPGLFLPAAKLIRASDTSPEVATIEEFVAARAAAFDAGEVQRFQENELSNRTEMFGNIAHRYSPYRKRAASGGEQIDVRGVILTQFVRTVDGWRISSMVWDDERA